MPVWKKAGKPRSRKTEKRFRDGSRDDVLKVLPEKVHEDPGTFCERSRISKRSRFQRRPAVQGLCIAAGLEPALACDLVWAAASARFTQAEASIGTTTLLGRVQRLTERAGPPRARDPRSQFEDELGKHGKSDQANE